MALACTKLVLPQVAAALEPLYGLLIPLWGAAMLEGWRLQQRELAVLWGVHRLSEGERISPAFRGERVVSLFTGETPPRHFLDTS